MEKSYIDSIIWGNFEERILEKQIPFFAGHWYLRYETEKALFSLYNGFIHFSLLKQGYRSSFPESEISDFDKNWWIDNLDEMILTGFSYPVDRVFTLPTIHSTSFEHDSRDSLGITIIYNASPVFECIEILDKTTQENFADFSEVLLKKEFHVHEKDFPDVLLHLKPLIQSKNKNEFLILRPDKLVNFWMGLDNYYEDFNDIPRVITEKEFQSLTRVEIFKYYGRTLDEIKFGMCNDENFKELFQRYTIDITPKKINFYEFIEDKIPSDLSEWNFIRDGFLEKLEKQIESEYLNLDQSFGSEKQFLIEAKDLFNDNHYAVTIVNCHKALEGLLTKILRLSRDKKFIEKIKDCEKNPKFQKYVRTLTYINKTRNEIGAHFNEEKVTKDEAKYVLQMSSDIFMEITRQKIG